MDKSIEYHAANGDTSPLDTSDRIAAAISDLSQRLLALETKPVTPAGTGGSNADIERIRAVIEPFFGSEFIEYDRTHDAKAAADANTGAAQPGA